MNLDLMAVLVALESLTIVWIIVTFRKRSRIRLIRMSKEIERATSGYAQTRLLAKGEQAWRDAVYATNALIEQLERVKIEAVQAQTARKRLLSGISHDIRTPLTSIIGYLDALKDEVAMSDQEKRDYLNIVHRKSLDLKQLIDEIFTMAKLDADELPQLPEMVDLAELARESVIGFLPELQQKGIESDIRLPDAQCQVFVDRLSVERVIGNLIRNAVQYGHEGRMLGVELLDAGDEYQLLVWDRGPGLSQGELTHVFERMYRGEEARNSVAQGSGLGLAIAKALAEKNGGRLWAESIPWERTAFGATFKKQLSN